MTAITARQSGGLQKRHLVIMSAAAAMLMITMGMRQSLGLFILPITDRPRTWHTPP